MPLFHLGNNNNPLNKAKLDFRTKSIIFSHSTFALKKIENGTK
jgi:hypothetical protein